MPEHRTPAETAPEELDRELDLRLIVASALGLAVICVLAAVVVWWISSALRSSLAAADPPPPVLGAARVQAPPPEPRLQASPEDDMRAMRTEEEVELGRYGWVDEKSGVLRVPIDVAIDLEVERLAGKSAVPSEEGGR